MGFAISVVINKRNLSRNKRVTLIEAKIRYEYFHVLCTLPGEDDYLKNISPWRAALKNVQLVKLSICYGIPALVDAARYDNTISILQTQALHFNAALNKIFATLIGVFSWSVCVL